MKEAVLFQNKKIEDGMHKKYEYIHSIVLNFSYLVFILINLSGAYYGQLQVSILLSISLLLIINIGYRSIKHEEKKLYFMSFAWISWFVLAIISSSGKVGIYNFYYFFLIVLILYQFPKIFLPIILFVSGFTALCFSSLWGLEQYEELIKIYLYSSEPTYEDFVIQLVSTNAAITIVWRTSFLLRRNTLKNISSEISQKIQNEQLEKNKAFAEEIAIGNFNINLEGADDDILAKSLVSMKESLQKAQEREQLEKEMNDFKNIGLVEIGKILRSEHDIEKMSVKIISKLTKYMGANMCAIYLPVEDKKGTILHLELKAAYAFDRSKHLKVNVLPGSGLVGTAFMEKENIFLTEIPENYIKIKSALGEILPRCLLLSPLISNQEVVGVIELASVKILKEYEIEFVNIISESIASTIINTKRNQQTEYLLEEAKQLTVEMQEKEEELKQNMEEMKATQEETSFRISQLEAQINKYERYK
jgi:methyl-accepting chemotaxis protein